MKRLLVVGLDGFDPNVGQTLLAQGKLPNLARLHSSRRFQLDPGVERYTGLAWEQFSSGLTPEESSRWSSNIIDTDRYMPDQPTTRIIPFTESLDIRTAVFDVPYFDLQRTSRAQGVVSWGTHDPGVPRSAQPSELLDELSQKFGDYPATEFIYGHVWNNPGKTSKMARAMVDAVNLRSDVTSWLFGERLRHWDLAITVISEYHSSAEALWHGWDESHPLHGKPSALPAREGFLAVYEAVDRMLGRLMEEFTDTAILAFTPHGMGPNVADVPAMLLLPELLYRHYTGRVGFRSKEVWPLDGTGGPDLPEDESWSQSVLHRMHIQKTPPRFWQRKGTSINNGLDIKTRLDWMPASQYRIAWPEMGAYAVPAYYEGMVRINLKGREKRGTIPRKRYQAELEAVAELIQGCQDPVTGEPIDVSLDLRPGDPHQRSATDADLIIRFAKSYYAFQHEKLGLIGPAPCRRPGGHTGGAGCGYLYTRPGGADPDQHLGLDRLGSDLGCFRTSEVSDAIGALVNQRPPKGALGAALVREMTI